MKMDGSISMEKLRQLCIEYDKEYHAYPENEFEGYSVFFYILSKIKNNPNLEFPSKEEYTQWCIDTNHEADKW